MVPDRGTSRVRRLAPLHVLDNIKVGLANEVATEAHLRNASVTRLWLGCEVFCQDIDENAQLGREIERKLLCRSTWRFGFQLQAPYDRQPMTLVDDSRAPARRNAPT